LRDEYPVKTVPGQGGDKMLDRDSGIIPSVSVYKMRYPLKEECHEDFGKGMFFSDKGK
jgi:hypothetical protein